MKANLKLFGTQHPKGKLEFIAANKGHNIGNNGRQRLERKPATRTMQPRVEEDFSFSFFFRLACLPATGRLAEPDPGVTEARRPPPRPR